MNNALEGEKVFTFIALYYRKKIFLKTCLVILKQFFLFCDNYIAMTYFTQVDTRL